MDDNNATNRYFAWLKYFAKREEIYKDTFSEGAD